MITTQQCVAQDAQDTVLARRAHRAKPRKPVQLLPEPLVVQTSPVDHALWNYRGILGAIQRTRFELARRLIGENHFDELLELGFGSGIFMPELAEHCHRLSGLDPHDKTEDAAQALSAAGIKADLHRCSASVLPFRAGSIGCVVAVSVLEFIEDLHEVCREVRRVLEPGGSFIVVTPGCSPVLDIGLKFLTGASAKEDFGTRRERVIPTLERNFRVNEILRYPSVRILGAHLYSALSLRKP